MRWTRSATGWLVAATLFGGNAGAQTVYTTTDPPIAAVPTICLTGPQCPALGQTFTALTGNLTSFGFYLVPKPSIGVLTARLYAWDGAAPTGSALFASTAGIFPSPAPPAWYDFATGGTALTPGGIYVAVLAWQSVSPIG